MSKNIDIIEAFNNCINCRDLEGLAELMTDNHRFIDSSSYTVTGKQDCLKAWKGFFSTFPDYRNSFKSMAVQENVVVISGTSQCSDERLSGSAIWTAKIVDSLVDEWRVWEDSESNRIILGVKD